MGALFGLLVKSGRQGGMNRGRETDKDGLRLKEREVLDLVVGVLTSQFICAIFTLDATFDGRTSWGKLRVRVGPILRGATLKGGSVFRWNYKAEKSKNTFLHYAQVFICFWPSKSKVCVIFALFSLRDIRTIVWLNSLQVRAICWETAKAKGGQTENRKRGEMHLALHHTWEESGVARANDVVLKLAKHCEQPTLSLDGLWPVRPHHRIFQRCGSLPFPRLGLFHWNAAFVSAHIPRHLKVLHGGF